MEKGERSSSVYEEINDKLAECCTFLVRYMQHANLPTEGVVGIYVENLTAFFKKRDCVLSFMLFKDVLQLCWKGNWELASALVCIETRVYNRAGHSSANFPFAPSSAILTLLLP